MIYNCHLNKEDAPKLVKIYIDAMQEKLDEDEKSFTLAEQRAIKGYHDFIIDLAGTSDTKSMWSQLPDEDEFITWLESEFSMDYKNAKKVANSVKQMDLRLPSLVSDPMSFLDVLTAIPDHSKRKKYLEKVSKSAYRIYPHGNCSLKTIKNGLSNINFYINFLNRKK